MECNIGHIMQDRGLNIITNMWHISNMGMLIWKSMGRWMEAMGCGGNAENHRRYPARGRCASTNTLSWCGYSAGSSAGPKVQSFEVVHEVVLDGDTCNLDRHCNHYTQWMWICSIQYTYNKQVGNKNAGDNTCNSFLV